MFSTISGGGILPYGYLGVDIFFVVGGFLYVKSTYKAIDEGRFNYWSFIFRKLVRLWPLILFVTAVAIISGYFLMLPDDYENLAESAVASSVFANNILQCITTKNYWDIVNLYKPLMHMWYVDVLMQAYIILPLIYMLSVKLCRNSIKGFKVATWTITAISLCLYIIPSISTAWKFYYIPFRLFELTAGGLVALYPREWKHPRLIGVIACILLLLTLCPRVEVLSGSVMLLVVVLLTMGIVSLQIEGINYNPLLNVFASIGKRSYSIYVWHQLIIAFMFYAIFPRQNVLSFITFAILTVVLSLLSYQFLEIPLGKMIGVKHRETYLIVGSIIFTAIICAFSMMVYLNAGVVRNVPELNVYKENAHRNMHAEYVDGPNHWAVGFTDNDKAHVLVLGNSFGRDWANILNEWDDNESLEISYRSYSETTLDEYSDLIEQADYVFFASGPQYTDVDEDIVNSISSEKLWIVGNKNYGESNGIIYAQRFRDNYFELRVAVPSELLQQIQNDQTAFGAHYINMMSPVLDEEETVQVFTDDHMFISQDCRHLTKAGAQYYSRILDIAKIFQQ